MTTENFAYWLKGYFELSGSNSLTDLQVEEIKNHLDSVFGKVISEIPYLTSTPNISTSDPPPAKPVLAPNQLLGEGALGISGYTMRNP